MNELNKADEILTELYWSMVDNHDDPKQIKRLDTIIGKIRDLKEIIEEGSNV